MASDPTRLPLSATRRAQPPPPIITTTTTSPSASIIPIRAPLSSDDHDDSDAGTLTSDDDGGFETASDPGEPSPESALMVRDSPLMPPRAAARPVAQISFDDDEDDGVGSEEEEEVFEEGLAEVVDGDGDGELPAVARVPSADRDSSLTDEGEVLEEGVDDGSVEESKDVVLREDTGAAGDVGAESDSLVASGAGVVGGDEERAVVEVQGAKDEVLNNGSEEVGELVVEQKEASETKNSPGSSIVDGIADATSVNSVALDVRNEKDEHLDDGVEEVGGLVVEQEEAYEPENSPGSLTVDEVADAAPVNSVVLDVGDEKDEHLNDGVEEVGGLVVEQEDASEPKNSSGSLIVDEIADATPFNSVGLDAPGEKDEHLDDGVEEVGGLVVEQNVGVMKEASEPENPHGCTITNGIDGAGPAKSAVSDAQGEKDEHLNDEPEEVGDLAGDQKEAAEPENFPGTSIMNEIADTEPDNSAFDARDEKEDHLDGAEEGGDISVEQKETPEPENSPDIPIIAENAGAEPDDSAVSVPVLTDGDKENEVFDVQKNLVSEKTLGPVVEEALGLKLGEAESDFSKEENDRAANAADSNEIFLGAEELKHDGVEADAPVVVEVEKDGVADASDLNGNLVVAEEPKYDGVADASDLNGNLVVAEEPRHDGDADASDLNDNLVAAEEPEHNGVADASDLNDNLVAAEEPKHDAVEADVLGVEEIGVSWDADSFQNVESSAEVSLSFTNGGSTDDAGVAGNIEVLDEGSIAVNPEIADDSVDKLDAVCESEAVSRSAFLIQDIGKEAGADPEQASNLKSEPNVSENPEVADDTVNKIDTVPANEPLEGGFASVNPEIADGSLDKLNAVCASEAVDRSAFLIQDIVDEVGAEPEQALNLKAEPYVYENVDSADDTVNEVAAVNASKAVDRNALLIEGIGDEKVGADSRELILKAEPNASETEFAASDGDLLLVPEVRSQPILVEQFKDSGTEQQVSETSLVVEEENSSVVSDETPTPGCVLGLEENNAADVFHMADDDRKEDPKAVEEEQKGLVSDGPARVVILESTEASKEIIKELDEGSSSASTFSVFGGSRDYSQSIDGQIASDSEEEMDNDEDGDGKELFDSAALAALLRAATSSSPDGTVTITPTDAARIFSVDRPAGLGSSVPSLKPAPARSTWPNIFTPSDLEVENEPENMNEEERKLHEKVELIRVKFLRLVQRLGHSPEDIVAAQVLYRLGLAEGLRHGKQASRAFSFDNARKKALELEVNCKEDLDFSCNILVIGKTGVGKSATVNSLFGSEKSHTNAFDRATTSVKEIVGVVEGVKIRVIDTPGLRSSVMDQASNKKILSSIKKYTKRCPPDIVLYVDRMDTQTRDFNDLPLLKSITSALGSSIWFNAIVALTHASSAPPEGPNGYPLSYDVFVAQRSHVVQHSIRQAAGDMRLMNPVALVENHPSCRRNRDGERVLPNGLSWKPQMLLLCYSSKILSEANSLLKVQDPSPGKLFGFRTRSPPLAYLLSSLLQSRSHPKLSVDQGGDNGDSDVDLDDLLDSDQEEVDEYDDLPPFKPLRKSQLAKLTKEQRRAYFDEYDYRVKLLQKKQWKEESRRLKEMKQHEKGSRDEFGYGDMADDFDQDNVPASVPVPMPDMALPPSFDCEHPVHRYRFLEPTSQLLARPVLDSHGWDHDCGYDGVSLEHTLAISGRFPAGTSVQITKDKKEFSIHLDSSIAAKHGETGSTLLGFDIQSIGKHLAYFFRGETKFKNLKKNKTAAGISVTLLGETVATGLKVEDELSVGRRVGLVASTGAVRSEGDLAYGANLEARLRDKDYPLGESLSTLGLSLLRWRGDTALGANLQSQFSIGRNSKMSVRVGLNNKMSGQITIRTSSSEHLQIALMAIVPIAMSIYRSICPGESIPY